MASISKLSVRGVRSFSPDDAEQVLEFYFPCTIIVGANGCGKTTIIESLKFAVCGALPPGNRSGQAFVHDPRSIGQSNVKANVKLRFTNRAGSSMVVVRSMEVTQKKTNLTFKQLDGVLRTVDRDGNRQSLSHKCSELDRQIPMLLGVSKPILEHVVFCHQEEASWPLQEGAVLKKRFDDIFDSTRYSKALEVFMKQKKELQSTVKDLKADLSGLASHKHAAKGFKDEIKAYNDQIEDVEDEIEQAGQDLKEVEDEQQRLQAIIDQAKESRNEIESRKNELGQQEAVVKKQRAMLEEDLTSKHNTRELKEMLRNFDNDVENQVERLEELRADVRHRREDIAKLRQDETDLQASMGRLMAEREAHEQRLQRRYEKMTQIGQKYSLGDVLSQIGGSQSQSANSSYLLSTTHDMSILGGSMSARVGLPPPPQDLEVSAEDMEEFQRALAKKETELSEALADHKARRQQQEDQLQSVLSDLVGRQKSIDNERAKLNKEQTDSRKELQQISSSVSSTSRVRQSDVEEAKRKAARVAKERDELNEDDRRESIPMKIRSLEEKMDRLKREIDDDQIVLKDLRHSADAQSSIEVLKEQCSKDAETLHDMISDQRFNLSKHNVTVPNELPDPSTDEGCSELSSAIERIMEDVSAKHEAANLNLSSATDEITRCQRIVSERSALIDRDRTALQNKKIFTNRLEDEDGVIKQVRRVVEALRQYEGPLGIATPAGLSDTTPQELHAYLNARVEEAENDSTDGIPQDMVRKMMTRLKKLSKTAKGDECPCCTRSMSSRELQAFAKQISFLVGDQSPLLKLDERNKAARAQYKQWRQLVAANMNDLLEYRHIAIEVGNLEKSVSELEDSLSVDNAELSQATEKHTDLSAGVDELRSMLDAAKRFNDFASRIAEKRMEISSKQLDLSMSNAGSGRSVRDVEAELNRKMEEKDSHSNQINKLNKEMSNLNSRIAGLSSTATRLDQIVRDKEAKLSKDKQNATRKAHLSDRISQCALEEKKLQDQIAPIRQKIRTKETEKQRMRNLANEDERKFSDNLNSFVADVKSLRELTDEIDKYQRSSKGNELDAISNKSSAIVEKMKEKEAELEKLQPSLDELTKAADDQNRHKKNLQENIELIQSVQRVEELKKEIQIFGEENGIVDGGEEEDYRAETKRKEKLLANKARLEGRRSEIVESIRSLKRKLSTPEYRNVDEEHRVASIKHETTQMAVRDIEKYYWALDKALLRFHSIKIGEINTIIRDLWYLTYKGEDITNIEIVSGQEDSSRAKRSYNYRVVMTKGGGAPLDMRGRCSAGQRVLASIVIRLALAETFCVNCGCIALDEPTVNLDHHNKRGLAIALAQIVASRSKQSNFQLILITHDEDFVAMMKTELSSQTGFSMPEKYFQVRREEGSDGKFYSKIDAIDWDELV